MPLRAEFRALYNTAAYRRERKAFIAAAGGPRCSRCRRLHPRVNLAHLTHDPLDRRPGARALLCPSCHARHDTPQRVAMTRRTRAKAAGQRWLTEELARAPWPVRTWPVRVRQMELF
jgi:hypothetical protein